MGAALSPYRPSDLEGRVKVVVSSPFEHLEPLCADLTQGMTIDEIVHFLITSPVIRDHIAAFVLSPMAPAEFIPRKMWGNVKPKAGTVVALRIVPSGPAIIGVLASVAGAATTNFLAGTAIGGALGGLGASIAGAVVTFAFQAIGQALFGPSQPTRTAETPVYSIDSARNQFLRYQPVPLVLGTHRVVPPLYGETYTEEFGDKQFLRMGVVWGYGPVEVTDIKIGETDLANFTGIRQQDDFDGTTTGLPLYATDVDQRSIGALLNETFTQRTTSIGTTDIGVTVTFPQGLTRIGSRGNPNPYGVRIVIEYRLTTDTVWTPWVDEIVVDDTTELLRLSWSTDGLPRGQYDVQMRRVNLTAADTLPAELPSFNTDGYYVDWPDSQTNVRVLDNAYWSTFRAFDDTKDAVNLAGIAKSAFRIRADEQLSGTVDELNAIVSLKLPVWDGSSWGGEQVTSNPAAIYRYILNGPANARPVGGAALNNQALGAWYDFCEAEGFTFDAVINYRTSVRNLIQDIAAAGRASPAFVDGKWTVIIQQPQTTIVQHFTSRNIRNFRSNIPFLEVPHGLRIRFLNRNKGYREAERIVYDDGFDETNATDFESIDLPGQTRPSNVYKLGRAFLAAMRLRPERFYWECDIEHIVCQRGDLIRVESDVALIGLGSGRITDINGLQVTVDEEITIEAGKDYRLRVRAPDGTSETTNVLSPAGSYYTFDVSQTSNLTVGDLFMFGERIPEGTSTEMLVANIEYLDDHDALIEAVPYDEAFYTAGDTIPTYTPVISDPVSPSFFGPPDPEIIEVRSDENALDPTVRGDISPAIQIYAEPGQVNDPLNGQARNTRTFWARWRRTNKSGRRWQYTAQVDVESPLRLQPVRANKEYDVQIQAVSRDGRVSNWVTVEDTVGGGTVTVVGLNGRPPQVDVLRTNTIGNQIQLDWEYPSIQPDVIGYEVRYHPNQDHNSWNNMSPITDFVSRETTSLSVPARDGTFAIKAIDSEERFSADATFANATEDDPPDYNSRAMVDPIIPNPSFDSVTKFNCVVNGTRLEIADPEVRVNREGFRLIEGNAYGYYGETDLTKVYTFEIVTDPQVGKREIGTSTENDAHRGWIEYQFSRDDEAGRTNPEDGLTPDLDYAQGDSFSVGTEVVRNASFSFVMDVTFPLEPEGVLLSMGGAANALYLGFDATHLIFRVGDATSRTAAQCAYKDQTLGNFAGKHGQLSGFVNTTLNSVTLLFTDFATMERTFLTGGQDATSFPSGNWTGTGIGMVGEPAVATPAGESTANFNGTISNVRMYNSSAIGLPTAGPTTWSEWRRIPGRAIVTARNLRFRGALATRDKEILARFASLKTRIRARPEQRSGEDIVANGFTTVDFSPYFYEHRGQPTINGQSLSSGDRYEITNLDERGFDIQFFDSSGTPVNRTFDYVQDGWGREKGT